MNILDQIKTFVGDLARPFAVIVTSGGASIATINISLKVTTGSDGAIFIGAVFAGLAGLYGLKAWEKTTEAKANANVAVETVRAGTGTTT